MRCAARRARRTLPARTRVKPGSSPAPQAWGSGPGQRGGGGAGTTPAQAATPSAASRHPCGAAGWNPTVASQLEQIELDRGVFDRAIAAIEAVGRDVVELGAEPGFGAAELAAPCEQLVEHGAGDALPPVRRCRADLVDIELGRLVRVPVDDAGALADD